MSLSNIHPEILRVVFFLVLAFLTLTPVLNISLYYSKLPVLLSNISALLCGIFLTWLRCRKSASFFYIFLLILVELAVFLYTLSSASHDVSTKKNQESKVILALNAIISCLLIIFLVVLVYIKYNVWNSHNEIIKMGGTISFGRAVHPNLPITVKSINHQAWPEPVINISVIPAHISKIKKSVPVDLLPEHAHV